MNSFGAYLSRKGEMFSLKVGEETKEIAAKKVSSIIIATKAVLSTDALKLSLDNNIAIVFIDDFGQPFGRVWHPKFGSTAYIRREQLKCADSQEGLLIAKELIEQKIENQALHIRDLAYKRDSKKENLQEYIDKIEEYKNKINKLKGKTIDLRGTIMGYEGNASKVYFEALAYAIPEPFKFFGRSFRPAKDYFNCILNYCYGILYSKVEQSCIIAGLDPFVGFLHTDNYNKKSLVFDVIEPFRDIGNRVAFSLFSKKKINKNFFNKIKNGLILNQEGKKAVFTALNEELERKFLYKKRKITRLASIQMACHSLANSLIGKGEEQC